ncbi:MAG: cupredoxin domain-containing protein [Candidatus Limnocylindria bacterium]
MTATLAAAIVLADSEAAPASAGRTVEIGIHHSRFSQSAVEVPAGVPVTFVLRNDDPIDHEWIVGDARVHEIHRAGTEALHDDRSTEVSLPPGGTRTTTITFDVPATLTFVCHFPGHEEYGMVGTLTVR